VGSAPAAQFNTTLHVLFNTPDAALDSDGIKEYEYLWAEVRLDARWLAARRSMLASLVWVLGWKASS